MYESVYLKNWLELERLIKLRTQFSLRRFNNCLSVLVIALACYVLIWPFIPSLTWWSGHHVPVIKRNYSVVVPVKGQPIPKDNELIIPRLGLKDPINEGAYITELRYGLWRIPTSSTPEEGSNTVIVGHRFTYSGEGVFYNLDKIQVGDKLIIFWSGKEYDYSVSSTFVVPETDLSIENPSASSMLTLYTCTPFWSFNQRLVIKANLI